jgi:hypothetical protein
MNNKHSRRQLTQYERQGTLFPIKVFSNEEAAYFKSGFEAVITQFHLSKVFNHNSLDCQQTT